MEKLDGTPNKKTFKGTAKAVGLATKLSPKAQRKKGKADNSTAQLKVTCTGLYGVR